MVQPYRKCVHRSVSIVLVGTCYYEKAVDYYTVTERLFKALRIPPTTTMESSSATVIKDAFLALNPGTLLSSAIKVEMNSMKRLKEVKICYNLEFQFISCM